MKKIGEWIKSVFVVYCREFSLLMHDGGIVLFFTFLPLVYPIVYSLIYNPEVVKDVPVVVVDHDRTAASRKLVRMYDASQQAWIKGYAADMSEARRALDSRECYGILEIPEGFAKKIGEGEQAKAVMYIDMSLMLRYKCLLEASTNVSQQMGAEIQEEKVNEVAPLAETISNGDLLLMHNVQLGDPTGGFCSFIMPGVLVLIIHQCLILAIGMAGGAKREKAYMIGYNPLNAVRSTLASMLGQIMCYVTIIVLPMIFTIHYVPLIFNMPMMGDIWQELMFLMPMVIACVALGMCFQGIVWEREAVFVLWAITSVALLFLSGLTWPRSAMSPFWKVVSDIIPATWGVQGFIQMNSDGAALSQVARQYENLWYLAVAYTVLGYFVQHWVVRPSIKNQLKAYFSSQSNGNTVEESLNK